MVTRDGSTATFISKETPPSKKISTKRTDSLLGIVLLSMIQPVFTIDTSCRWPCHGGLLQYERGQGQADRARARRLGQALPRAPYDCARRLGQALPRAPLLLYERERGYGHDRRRAQAARARQLGQALPRAPYDCDYERERG